MAVKLGPNSKRTNYLNLESHDCISSQADTKGEHLRSQLHTVCMQSGVSQSRSTDSIYRNSRSASGMRLAPDTRRYWSKPHTFPELPSPKLAMSYYLCILIRCSWFLDTQKSPDSAKPLVISHLFFFA